MQNRSAVLTFLVVVLLCTAMVAQGLSDIVGMSVTWDEAMYLGVGNFIIRTGHFDFAKIEALHFHPIWTFYANSILLLFLNLPKSALTIPAGSVYTPTAGAALLFHSGYSPDIVLLLARLPILAQTVFLSVLVYKFSRQLFGNFAGLLSLALVCFDPNLIAHSSLATTDSSMTVWIFATTYFYWLYLSGRSKKTLLATGICMGIAFLSKVSALIILPITLSTMYAAQRFPEWTVITKNVLDGDSKSSWTALTSELHRLQHVVSLIAIACLIIWIAYGFGINASYKSASQISAEHLHFPKSILQSTEFVRLPLAPYIDVLAYVLMGAVGMPRHAYLLGRQSTDGFREYVFVDFFIKTPVPVLLMIGLAVVFWKRTPRADRVAESCLLAGIFIPVLFAIPEKSNCGIRYFLSLYPYLHVWLGRLLGKHWHQPVPKLQALLASTIFILTVWNAFESIVSCPDQIAYFNSVFRTPAQKFRYLADSNLDWGNELYALKRFMDVNNIHEVSLDYFGNVNPSEYGICWKQATNESTGWIAISATNLVGAYGAFNWSDFRNKKPVAVLSGGGMLIYYR